MKRKYPKTQGYYVYSHSIDGIVYYGVSKLQPNRRWKKCMYVSTSLSPYLNRWDDDETVHTVIKDGLTREDALKLEDELILGNPNCINERRSGLIRVYDVKQYDKQRYEENREKRKQQIKKWDKEHRSNLEYKIYYRVASYNQKHPNDIKETPKHAKEMYLLHGIIPTYIKHDDLMPKMAS